MSVIFPTRPHTTVVLAMTADGKIASAKKSPARFSANADKAHLEKQISLVDGVLFGAGTLRAYGTTLPICDPQLLQARSQQLKPPQPVHIVCSATAQLNPQLRFFRQPVPRWLLTTKNGAELWQNSKGFERIVVAKSAIDDQSGLMTDSMPDARYPKIDWTNAFTQFTELGLNKLAILGGGELVASLLAEDLIDEFWLTVCPVIFGGAGAPTPVEGVGLLSGQAKRLELLSAQRVEQEVFLHYRLQH